MNRRGFLKLASLVPAAGLMPSTLWAASSKKTISASSTPSPTNTQETAATAPKTMRRRNIVLIKLSGGNDGLNTLVPLKDYAKYQKFRPTLSQPAQAYKLASLDGSGMALNLYMSHLSKWWNQGNVAWIQGVGYEHPILSHFRSSDIWDTASDAFVESEIGWLAQVLPQYKSGLHGIIVGEGLGPMSGKDCHTIAMQSPQVFLNQISLVKDANPLRNASSALTHITNIQHQLHEAGLQIKEKMGNPRPIPGFANGVLGRRLESVAQMILSDVDTAVYKVEHSGFDTHANQLNKQNNLLNELAIALDSFANTMQANGRWDDVLVVTYSEFGRRVQENKGGGTDHGAASVQLVMGGKVRGGVYGERPNLNELDKDGNLHMTTDFRQVYGTLASRWFNVNNPWSQFKTIPFV